MRSKKLLVRLLFITFMLGSFSANALELKGRLEWVDKADMRVVENGVVEEVKATTGQHVSKGDLLLRLDQRKQKAALLEAQAGVARAQLGMEDAEREMGRTQELYDRGLIAEEELKDGELKLAVAHAELESAKASAEAAQVALDYTELRAPFSGIVTAVNAWQGAVIFASKQDAPLLSMAPDAHMLARALVTSNILRQHPVGSPAQIVMNGAGRNGKVYRHGVEAVRIEPEGAIYELDVIFKRQSNELLRPSESVRLVFP